MKKVLLITMFCSLCVAGILFFSHTAAEAALWDVLDPFTIPIYPALQKVSEQKMLLNGQEMKMILLSGEDVSIPNMVEYYKMVLVQKGWIAQGEESLIKGALTLNFSKDSQQLIVDFFSGELMAMLRRKSGTNQVAVRLTQIKGEKDTIQKIQSALYAQQDMPGEDILWLKRYPNSIRFNSVKMLDTGFISANYKVADYTCIQCVADFYSEQMKQQGWRLLAATEKTKDNVHYDERTKKAMEERFAQMQQLYNAQSTVAYSSDEMKTMLSNYLPDSVKTMAFQKGGEMCIVTVSYTGQRAQQAQQYQETITKQLQHVIEAGDNEAVKPQALSPETLNAYVQETMKAFSGQFQEKIEIGIQYIPKGMLQARSS